MFRPEIYGTPARPDIIIWSYASRRVILIELTCPAEEGIQAAKTRTLKRYAPLCSNIPKSWSSTLMTIEVGARGFVGNSVRSCFRKLGLPNRDVTLLCKSLSQVSARCSYAIYLSRKKSLCSS